MGCWGEAEGDTGSLHPCLLLPSTHLLCSVFLPAPVPVTAPPPPAPPPPRQVQRSPILTPLFSPVWQASAKGRAPPVGCVPRASLSSVTTSYEV